MFKQFLKPSNPLLTKKAKDIPLQQISSKETREIINTMLKIAYGEQKEKSKPVMVGLAASQIGILKRIILVDVRSDGKGKVGDLRIYINPAITWASKQKGEWYEGCFSTGKVCGVVSRPTSIKIKGFALDSRGVATLPPPRWNVIEKKYSGYVARIFQHEIDHLNGRVFVDRIKDANKLHWVEETEFRLYRNKQAWKNWPKKCSFEKWGKIKNLSC